MKKEKILKHHTVTVEHNDKQYQGSYTVEGQYITVHYRMATTTSRPDQSRYTFEQYAHLLLSEMVSQNN